MSSIVFFFTYSRNISFVLTWQAQLLTREEGEASLQSSGIYGTKKHSELES